MTATRPPGRIEMLKGQQLYFELHGTGEPLLLLHGFSGSSQDWSSSLTQWGTKFQCILPDLRGHGRSGTLAKPFRHDEAAADMFALLDHLKIASSRPLASAAVATSCCTWPPSNRPAFRQWCWSAPLLTFLRKPVRS